jgi:hypothetical protein
VGVYLRPADRAVVCEGEFVWRGVYRDSGGGIAYGDSRVWEYAGRAGSGYFGVRIFGLWVVSGIGVWIDSGIWFRVWFVAGNWFSDASDYAAATASAVIFITKFVDTRGLFWRVGDGAEFAYAALRAYYEG